MEKIAEAGEFTEEKNDVVKQIYIMREKWLVVWSGINVDKSWPNVDKSDPWQSVSFEHCGKQGKKLLGFCWRFWCLHFWKLNQGMAYTRCSVVHCCRMERPSGTSKIQNSLKIRIQVNKIVIKAYGKLALLEGTLSIRVEM